MPELPKVSSQGELLSLRQSILTDLTGIHEFYVSPEFYVTPINSQDVFLFTEKFSLIHISVFSVIVSRRLFTFTGTTADKTEFSQFADSFQISLIRYSLF